MGLFDSFTGLIEDTIDVGLGIVTLGEYGEISKHKVAKLISGGLTIAAAAAAFGVAESVIEEMLED